MKRIILIREYVLLLIIFILGTLMFYGIENFEWLKRINISSQLSAYLFTIFMYVLVLLGVFIRKKRLKANKMKAIKSDGIIIKSLIIISILVIHILYWYLYFKNSCISIAGFLGSSIYWPIFLLRNTVYISNKIFVVGNKMYFIENIEELIDDSELSFKVIIYGDIKTVRCGSNEVKEKLIKEVKLLKNSI